MDMAQEARSRYTPVTGKAPTEARLPRMGGYQTADSHGKYQALKDNGATPVVQRLIEELKDGNQSWGVEETVKVLHTEEHRDRVEPGRHEADSYGAHDGKGYGAFRPRYFFSHVRCAVETCKSPIGVDEADNEGDAIGRPSRVVSEVGEDKAGFLVRGRFSRDSNKDY